MRILSISLVVALFSLVGCSAPPDCTSDQAATAILDAIKTSTALRSKIQAKDDPNNIVKDYLDGLQVKLSEITRVQYDEAKRLRVCEANVIVATPMEQELKGRFRFGFQTLEDGGTKFHTSYLDPLLNQTEIELRDYYAARRFNGTWTGTYRCETNHNAADPLTQAATRKPFSVPMEVSVRQGEGRFDRATDDGGTETIHLSMVNLHRDDGALWDGEINGPRFGQEKRQFQAKLSGSEIQARGWSKSGTSQYAAACTIQLRKQ